MTESISLTILTIAGKEPGFITDGTDRWNNYKLVAQDKSTGIKYVIWYEDGTNSEVEDEIILSGGKGKWGSLVNVRNGNSSVVVYVETVVQNKTL